MTEQHSNETDRGRAPNRAPDPETQPTCFVCGQPIQGISYDAWLFVTVYNENGEVDKTGEEVNPGEYTTPGTPDYVSVGECHRATLIAAWEDFLDNLMIAK